MTGKASGTAPPASASAAVRSRKSHARRSMSASPVPAVAIAWNATSTSTGRLAGQRLSGSSPWPKPPSAFWYPRSASSTPSPGWPSYSVAKRRRSSSRPSASTNRCAARKTSVMHRSLGGPARTRLERTGHLFVVVPVEADGARGRVHADHPAGEAAGDLGGQVPAVERGEHGEGAVGLLDAEGHRIRGAPGVLPRLLGRLDAEHHGSRGQRRGGQHRTQWTDAGQRPRLPVGHLDLVVVPLVHAYDQSAPPVRRVDQSAYPAGRVLLAPAHERHVQPVQRSPARAQAQPPGTLV